MDSKFVWAVVSVVIVVMHNMQPAAALTHIVGGSFGWKIPPNNTFYDQWAKTHTFNLNDKLGVHNVLDVSKADYKGCTQVSNVNQHYIGPTTVELTTPGTHYFYCGIGMHCEAGQKLKISIGTSDDNAYALAPSGRQGSSGPSSSIEDPTTPEHKGTTSSAHRVHFSGAVLTFFCSVIYLMA